MIHENDRLLCKESELDAEAPWLRNWCEKEWTLSQTKKVKRCRIHNDRTPEKYS